MSTLTKICVVVLVVLVLVACPIFISQATTGPNWKSAFQGKERQCQMAEAAAVERGLAADLWRSRSDEYRQKLETTSDRFRTELDAKRAQVAQLSQINAAKQGDIDKLIANETELQNALKKAIALNEAQGEELKNERQKTIDLGNQLTRTQAKNEELLSDVNLLKRAREVLEVQVAQKDAEIADLRQQLKSLQEAGVRLATAEPKVAGPKIQATVTAVKGDIASLNVGSASGVKKGTKFIIYREADFVAHLQVEYVDASQCSGIIVDAQRDVRINDRATTSLQEQ